MSRLVEAKRTIALLVLLMAAVVMLSGPVAEVLDPGSEPVAEAKKKHKKKKKKKKRPPAPVFNIVQCPTESDGIGCIGTAGNDLLVGTADLDAIRGLEGNDVYQGNGGNNSLEDTSTTSNDSYTVVDPEPEVNTAIVDSGGSADFLDMGTLRVLDDVSFQIFGDDLVLTIRNSSKTVAIDDHFGAGRIETIRFANATITGT